jgi:hypothetical protein
MFCGVRTLVLVMRSTGLACATNSPLAYLSYASVKVNLELAIWYINSSGSLIATAYTAPYLFAEVT